MTPVRGLRLGPPAPLLCRWDLDKTYLRSEFDTLRGLVRIPFEHAEDKVNVPGVVPYCGIGCSPVFHCHAIFNARTFWRLISVRGE